MNGPGHNLRWQNYVHPCLHKYAQDQLLLGEGVCRRLGIVNYHPKVEIWRGRCKGKDNSNSSDGIVTVLSTDKGVTIYVCFTTSQHFWSLLKQMVRLPPLDPPLLM